MLTFDNYKFNSEDLAIIIPTKDRPLELKRILSSIVELDCKVGRVIVVSSGINVGEVLKKFKKFITIEYYQSEPGQIKQRNLGISKLTNSTKLVATMDDDAVFLKNSVSEMIKFWNSVDTNTAGVGFNVINQKPHNHSWFKGLIGVSVSDPGKVLKCGRNTKISNVIQDISTEWLNGGGTVWKQSILQENEHKEINSKWAVYEDLIYSYSIGKKNNLYVSNKSKIRIDDNKDDDKNYISNYYKGKTQFLWKLYFIKQHKNLSLLFHLYSEFIHVLHHLFVGVIKPHKIFWGLGIINGMVLLLLLLKNGQSIINLIEENT